jgi:DNA ligase (NAD+)
MEQLKKLSLEQLTNTKGIGQITAQNFIDFTHSAEFQHLKEQFQDLEQNQRGISIKRTTTAQNLPLSGYQICLTGTFDNYSRDELTEKLQAQGAKVTKAVSQNTTLLLAGKNPGESKIHKAKTNQVKVISDLAELGIEIYL